MEPPTIITITPSGHPDPRVAHAGFGLDHAYVERCWAPVLGPTSTLLLRQLPTLWAETDPLRMDLAELSRTVGVGAGHGAHSPLSRALDRLVRFRLARPGADRSWEVFRQVRPLGANELRRVPEWSRQMHTRLLDQHIAELTAHSPTARLTARLDHLQARPTPSSRTLIVPRRAPLQR